MIAHLVTLGILLLLIGIFRNHGEELAAYFHMTVNVQDITHQGCFSLFIWQAALMLFAFTPFGKIVCRQGILIQILAAIGFFVATFWFGNFFKGWIIFSRIGSGVWLLFQAAVVVHLSYVTNDKVLNMVFSDGEANSCVLWTIIGLCSSLILGAFILLGFFYHWFGDNQCAQNQAAFTLTYIFSVLALAVQLYLSVRDSNSRANVLSSTAVILNAVYYAWSAGVYAEPPCNGGTDSSNTALTVISLILTIASILYSGYSVTQQEMVEKEELVTGDVEDAKAPAETVGIETPVQTKQPEPSQSSKEQGEPEDSAYEWCFHLAMAMVACYTDMLFTNWGGLSNTNFWSMIVAQWFSFFVYGWTLFFPVLFPHRFME